MTFVFKINKTNLQSQVNGLSCISTVNFLPFLTVFSSRWVASFESLREKTLNSISRLYNIERMKKTINKIDSNDLI